MVQCRGYLKGQFMVTHSYKRGGGVYLRNYFEQYKNMYYCGELAKASYIRLDVGGRGGEEGGGG